MKYWLLVFLILVVSITGTLEGRSFNDDGDRLKIVRVEKWGSGDDFAGFKYLNSGFYGCTNLTKIGDGPIKASGAAGSLYRDAGMIKLMLGMATQKETA